MALIRESRVITLGTGDGTQTAFTTPTPYFSGSIRAIVNGLVYGPSDARYGWSETSTTTIAFDVAPLAGDVLEAFYQENDAIDTGGGGGGPVVAGRPYAPG